MRDANSVAANDAVQGDVRGDSSVARRLAGCCVAVALLIVAGVAIDAARAHTFNPLTGQFEALDPARGVPLACEAISGVGSIARAAKNIVHRANFCGIVGTDTEFQTRTDAQGNPRHYAFVGSMGYGFRIVEITDFTADQLFPVPVIRGAGGYSDAGWQNDIQVRGNIAISTFDGVAGEDSTASTCLKLNYPDANGQGVDIFTLNYDPFTGNFAVENTSCIGNPPGGAHTATLHPGGEWLAISNSSSDWAVDLIDIIDPANPVHRYRFIDPSRNDASKCPPTAGFTCVNVQTVAGEDPSLPGGEGFRPHDIHFTADGNTMFVAAIQSTWILDVTDAMTGAVETIAIIDNDDPDPEADPSADIAISHQVDITPDGKILVVTDEAGGGISNANCNTASGGIIGSMHFYAVAPIDGQPQTATASMANPVKLGFYVNPNPVLSQDPLQDEIEALPVPTGRRAERGCTVHVFRIGGNGSSSPGPALAGFDGVSSLGNRRLVTSWYGGGVWHVDFSGPSSSLDGGVEDPRSTWGNTLGFSVMPGGEAWSAKEYKGVIVAGDMTRGIDLYTFDDCDGPLCFLEIENDPPNAVDDAAEDQTGQSVTIPVLANDDDVNEDQLRVAQFTQGTNGTVTDNLDGTLTYTHDGSTATSDSFTYTIDDGRGGNDTATVSITLPDADLDGVSDGVDNCASTANADQADVDGDGVGDVCDNCLEMANPDQCNTNAPDADAGDLGDDNIGNVCDADLDNNGIVNSFDLTILRSRFGQAGENDADITCNGIVNTFDLTELRDAFGQAPGPSGIAP